VSVLVTGATALNNNSFYNPANRDIPLFPEMQQVKAISSEAFFQLDFSE